MNQKEPNMCQVLSEIQDSLYHISAYIASQENEKYLKCQNYDEKLEIEIDKMESKLPPLKNFIHPGGSVHSAQLHVARSIARRVERRYVTHSKVSSNDAYLKFFNRLSDYLFVSARYANMISNTPDVIFK
jgi:cob(I)alamin adenosyltransferase